MKTVWYSNKSVRMIDQALLPERLKVLTLRTPAEVAGAIREMKVRGAPAIGVTAALGLALAAARSRSKAVGGFLREMRSADEILRRSRPTARNLFWALDRVGSAMDPKEELASLRASVVKEALLLAREDAAACRAMARHGARLLRRNSTVITHCNTGALAATEVGTALGVIIEAHRLGRVKLVLVDETRPRLQGARLTAWELKRAKVPFRVIADGASAFLMSRSKVDAAFVGADCIARNGDTANKIGTYALALACREAKVPFYVVAPLTTFSRTIKKGRDIPIEERAEDEVLAPYGLRLAAPGSRAWNPAFDVTPAALIRSFVTEIGVLKPPFKIKS